MSIVRSRKSAYDDLRAHAKLPFLGRHIFEFSQNALGSPLRTEAIERVQVGLATVWDLVAPSPVLPRQRYDLSSCLRSVYFEHPAHFSSVYKYTRKR